MRLDVCVGWQPFSLRVWLNEIVENIERLFIFVWVLPPILADLRDSHPEIEIELVPSNRLTDLLRRDADIAVRMQRPQQGVLIARHIGAIELGVYAHRQYLRRKGTPATLDDLAAHALIGYDKETTFVRGVKEQLPWIRRHRFALRTDSDLAGLAALRAGFGIGFCQVGLAKRNRALVRLFADEVRMDLDTWVAMHEDLRDSPRCRATFDALVAGLSRYVNGD